MGPVQRQNMDGGDFDTPDRRHEAMLDRLEALSTESADSRENPVDLSESDRSQIEEWIAYIP